MHPFLHLLQHFIIMCVRGLRSVPVTAQVMSVLGFPGSWVSGSSHRPVVNRQMRLCSNKTLLTTGSQGQFCPLQISAPEVKSEGIW
jgi:hypothetical protein